jgi:hypothetical protein
MQHARMQHARMPHARHALVAAQVIPAATAARMHACTRAHTGVVTHGGQGGGKRFVRLSARALLHYALAYQRHMLCSMLPANAPCPGVLPVSHATFNPSTTSKQQRLNTSTHSTQLATGRQRYVSCASTIGRVGHQQLTLRRFHGPATHSICMQATMSMSRSTTHGTNSRTNSVHRWAATQHARAGTKQRSLQRIPGEVS